MAIPFIHHRDLAWEDVDWEKQSTSEIAFEMDVTLSRVSLMRRRHAPHTVRKLNPGRWDGVDWSQPDIEIARQLGVSRQLVNITRKRNNHQKPNTL